MKRSNIFLYLTIIITAAATRILPHAWNFAPVTAIAIVAAVYLPVRQALFLTLAVRLISDVIIGFFAWPLMFAVYLSHLFGVVMGLWVRKSVASPLPSPLSPFLISLPRHGEMSRRDREVEPLELPLIRLRATFPLKGEGNSESYAERVPEGRVRLGMWSRVVVAPLISALVFFLVTNFAFFYPTYTHDISGVILAYTNGLPFLRGTLLGDVGYTIVFVASFEAVRFYLRHRAACARSGFKIA